jgi:hypothetical protein
MHPSEIALIIIISILLILSEKWNNWTKTFLMEFHDSFWLTTSDGFWEKISA